MKFVAGIDGGGTRTKVECRSEQGSTLCRREFGPFNLNSIGAPRFAALLAEITDFLAGAGECTALCAGAAGISNPEVKRLMAAAMEHSGIARWKLVGDHEIALYGALSGAPGCALIAGTGSICCGRNAAGKFARSGGWGHLIDDGGSGYALGRDAAAAAVRQWDGRGEETLLSMLITRELGISTPEELTAYVYGGDKSRLAALAPLMQEAAAAGDAAALRIYRQNGGELGRLVCAVAGKLELVECETALLGGVLEKDKYLREMLMAYLAENAPGIRCVEPRQDALSGAVLIAADLAEEEERRV